MEYFGYRVRVIFLYGMFPIVIVEQPEFPESVSGGEIGICPLCANGRLFTPTEMMGPRC